MVYMAKCNYHGCIKKGTKEFLLSRSYCRPHYKIVKHSGKYNSKKDKKSKYKL